MGKINGYNKEIGLLAEEISAKYMENLGFEILQTNYKRKGFEIDIICKKENLLVFVEVKYRRNLSYGHPLESIDIKKQEKIRRGAERYIQDNDLTKCDVRFDCIGILNKEIIYVENGF